MHIFMRVYVYMILYYYILNYMYIYTYVNIYIYIRERANAVEIDFGKIGHLRPLAVTCPLRSLAVTCGHWVGLVGHLLQRPLAPTRVAASGCKRSYIRFGHV